VGRTALLARLDQLLIEEPADRWVVVTGGLRMGKSALLAAWLARREAAAYFGLAVLVRLTSAAMLSCSARSDGSLA